MLFYHKRQQHTTHTTKIKEKFDRILLDISTFRGYFRAYKCQTPGTVKIDELDQFAEAGACGTAAVISPIGGIQYKDNFHVFYSETEVGPVTKALYEELTGIQFGEKSAPEGWIFEVE